VGPWVDIIDINTYYKQYMHIFNLLTGRSIHHHKPNT